MKIQNAILALFLLPFVLFAEASLLQSKLQQANVSDYIVACQDKNISLLIVREKQNGFIKLEQIQTGLSKTNKKDFDWKAWVESGAAGSTNWLLMTIDASTCAVTKVYSYTREAYILVDESMDFFAKLMGINFNFLVPGLRPKVGGDEGTGPKAEWKPCVRVNGSLECKLNYDVYRGYWPKDGSQLDSAEVDVYLPLPNQNVPTSFPLWIELKQNMGKGRITVFEAGSQIRSPQSAEGL